MKPIPADDAVDRPTVLDLDHLPATLGVGTVEGLDDNPVESSRLEIVIPATSHLHVFSARHSNQKPGAASRVTSTWLPARSPSCVCFRSDLARRSRPL